MWAKEWATESAQWGFKTAGPKVTTYSFFSMPDKLLEELLDWDKVTNVLLPSMSHPELYSPDMIDQFQFEQITNCWITNWPNLAAYIW